MQIFVYFSLTCFGLIRPSSGAIEFIISFTNAAYGVLGAARCLEKRARWWCVALLALFGSCIIHILYTVCAKI